MKNSQFVIYPLSILLDYNVFLHKYFIMLASNSCHDRQFVKREVIEYLEETFGYTLCIHERDFMVGDTIPANIDVAIKHSQLMIVVISR